MSGKSSKRQIKYCGPTHLAIVKEIQNDKPMESNVESDYEMMDKIYEESLTENRKRIAARVLTRFIGECSEHEILSRYSKFCETFGSENIRQMDIKRAVGLLTQGCKHPNSVKCSEKYTKLIRTHNQKSESSSTIFAPTETQPAKRKTLELLRVTSSMYIENEYGMRNKIKIIRNKLISDNPIGVGYLIEQIDLTLETMINDPPSYLNIKEIYRKPGSIERQLLRSIGQYATTSVTRNVMISPNDCSEKSAKIGRPMNLHSELNDIQASLIYRNPSIQTSAIEASPLAKTLLTNDKIVKASRETNYIYDQTKDKIILSDVLDLRRTPELVYLKRNKYCYSIHVSNKRKIIFCRDHENVTSMTRFELYTLFSLMENLGMKIIYLDTYSSTELLWMINEGAYSEEKLHIAGLKSDAT